MRVVTRIRGVNRVRKRLADGSWRTFHYHRGTGVRLPDDPASPAFLAAWREAEASLQRRRPTDTIDALIDLFRDSADWAALRESTRTIMTLNLAAVAREFGSMPIAGLEDRRCRADFLEWRDRLARKHPRAADNKLAALQRVLSWAHDRGLVPANPLEKFRRVYASDRADKIWLPHHVAAMEGVAPPDVLLVMMLALHTGQRQDDILRLTWSAFDGEAISLVQSKTRKRVYVPCTSALRAVLAPLAAAEDRGLYIASRAGGRPWTKDAFKRAWSTAFATTKINDDLHFHDLRGTAVTMLAEAGCTIPEIAAITGHSLQSATRIVEVYMARTRALATTAIAKLDEHQRNRFANQVANRTP